MILALRLFFGIVLISMIATVGWACLEVPLWDLPKEVSGHPWFIATLADVYWGFLIFWLWIAYRETSWLARGLWLVGMLGLGNITAALYGFIQVCSVPLGASIDDVLLRRKSA